MDASRPTVDPTGPSPTSIGGTPLGVTFASFSALGPAAGLHAAARAVELGYSSFWVAETVGMEAFATLAAVGAAQPSLSLGTGVLALQLRTPAVTAMGAATLQALHPERDILLGVGISSPAVVNRWHGASYGAKPLAQTREYLTLLRECLSGEKVTFQGDHYQVKGFRLGIDPGERRPKIILAALNPRMLEMAGELADGVLLNYLPASHVAWSVEQVRRGGDATVYAYVHVGVTEREPNLDRGRRDIFSYAVVDSYANNFIRAGFADEVAEIRERHSAGDRDGAVAAVSDRMVDAIDVLGDAAHVRATVQAYVDAGVEVPVIMPMPWGANRQQVIDDTLTAAVGLP
jgi:probable F420-dependent oxidoreductase